MPGAPGGSSRSLTDATVPRRALREALLWVPVGLAPILNGAARVFLYGSWLGEPAASLVSSSLDAILACAWACAVQRRWPVATGAGAVRRGATWLALTTVSHFGLGALAFGIPFAALVAKYDVLRGETWLLVSAAILVAPIIARGLLGPRPGRPATSSVSASR